MNNANSKIKALLPTTIALGVILVAGMSIVFASGNQDNGSRAIAEMLTARLHQAIKDAELTGGFTTDEHGNKVYSGQTAEKIQQFHDEAAKAHMATLERPATERQGAISRIQEFVSHKSVKGFVGDQTNNIRYTFTGKSSYDSNIITEFYQVGQDYVEIDIRNNKIVQFGPAPTRPGEEPKKFDTSAKFSVAELQAMANEFVNQNTKLSDLSTLKASVGNKGEINYFFRWDDANKILEDGRPAFVQVGFTIGGELLSYTNSLGV
jgi:hypothetical protein